jgi:hypothetical protein
MKCKIIIVVSISVPDSKNLFSGKFYKKIAISWTVCFKQAFFSLVWVILTTISEPIELSSVSEQTLLTPISEHIALTLTSEQC